MNDSIKLAEGTTLTEVGGKHVLFSVKSGESFGLNETAAHMLTLCLELGVARTVQKLAEEYSVNAQELSEDLQALIDGLSDANLVQVQS
ncbi:PqqD family protein [Orrella marina]|uniref:PqqD family protein n=1 Tax=Orrella marina TaxID=2163011 RepID=A0A2R4XG27_9BURK|nr:PqqD family protein [Orrella marina]AWB32744.1 hypothetical protein DBV39_02335 [Orrella marina]